MALGAQTTDVLKLVVRDGLKLVVIGVLVGLVGAFMLTRLYDHVAFRCNADRRHNLRERRDRSDRCRVGGVLHSGAPRH